MSDNYIKLFEQGGCEIGHRRAFRERVLTETGISVSEFIKKASVNTLDEQADTEKWLLGQYLLESHPDKPFWILLKKSANTCLKPSKLNLADINELAKYEEGNRKQIDDFVKESFAELEKQKLDLIAYRLKSLKGLELNANTMKNVTRVTYGEGQESYYYTDVMQRETLLISFEPITLTHKKLVSVMSLNYV